jgi:2-polyprenyl-6-methoxyphenol hydroxylase-like FAD-dependent oxidoreductase
MRGWHPDLLRLVADSDPGTVATVSFRSMAKVAPWPATNVTLIGDAIHNMTPMAGIGACAWQTASAPSGARWRGTWVLDTIPAT